jgi:molybdopterin synthase catalytic subunit
MSFQLSPEPIDTAQLLHSLRDQRAGACAIFEGQVRNHNEGRSVRALEYEAHVTLAEKEGKKILDEAREKFGILGAGCVHRIGTLEPGDLAVWVGVIAEHRGAAFDACRYIIDETKARVPIWKREHYSDGTVDWINSTKS